MPARNMSPRSMSKISLPDTITHPADPELQSEENQPLLSKPKTPLPKLQLSLLFFIRATDPICFQVIFPFINQMLLDIGASDDPDRVGYKAGLVESLFALTQLVTIFHWGALSDRIGRKPVLLIGCIGSSISAIAFGFSRSYTLLIISRCINGAMNGNIAILKSAIAEITDETNEARAFSLFPICLNTGIIISSFLGGTFANTRGTKFAQMLPLFETFPYLLPMLLASVFPLLSGCLAYFYLEETLATRKEVSSENGDDPTPETSVKALFTWQISLIIFSFGIISLFGVALLALVPLFCFTALDKGGLGFDARQIGWVISQRSISVMIIQVIAFPWLQKRFGTVPLYKLCSILWIPGFVMLPLANLVARHGKEIWVWVGIYAFMLVTGLANLGFVCNLLMTNAAAPSPQLLGSINGYAQMISSFVGIIGPGGMASIFALSVDHQILSGNLVWLVLVAIAAIGTGAAFLM